MSTFLKLAHVELLFLFLYIFTYFGLNGNVEDPKNAHLRELEGAKERLSLRTADLLDFESLKEAINGCDGVFHTASPVTDDPVSFPCQRLLPLLYLLSFFPFPFGWWENDSQKLVSSNERSSRSLRLDSSNKSIFIGCRHTAQLLIFPKVIDVEYKNQTFLVVDVVIRPTKIQSFRFFWRNKFLCVCVWKEQQERNIWIN